MRCQPFYILGLLAGFFILDSWGAQKHPPPVAQRESTSPIKDGTLRVDVNLVQVDAIVTDNRGRYLTDLQANDFELYQNGVKQRITHFSYIENQPFTDASRQAESLSPKKGVPSLTRPFQLKPEQVRRTIALVVDDSSLARLRCLDFWNRRNSNPNLDGPLPPESEGLGSFFVSQAFRAIYEIRQSLTKFVDQQIGPGDLVAILRTGSNVGVLEQFTSDKRLLHGAIKVTRLLNLPCSEGPNQVPGAMNDAGFHGTAGEWLDRARNNYLTGPSLAVLRYVLDGMKELPGHKVLVLLSTDYNLVGESPLGRLLSDAAIRAGVTIYEIDPKGLVATTGGSLFRADSTSMTFEEIMSRAENPGANFDLRSPRFRASVWPNQTGGLSFSTNDISKSLGRILADQEGFYLIGYQPGESSFTTEEGKPQFHSITLKVKRAGLQVRTRSGFFGIETSKVETVKPSPTGSLMRTLRSPFASNQIPVKLTSLIGFSSKEGLYVHLLFHIDPTGLLFQAPGPGLNKGVLEVMAAIFDENGEAIDVESKSFNLQVRDENLDWIKEKGLNFTLDFPVKKPRGYQLRVAVRDPNSGHVGSASQLVEVPDILKGQFALSGIMIQGGTAGSWQDSGKHFDSFVHPAERKFRQGISLNYQLFVYNASIDATTGHPELEIKVQLFKDGREFDDGKINTPLPTSRLDSRRLLISGSLLLNGSFTPGEYLVQCTVRDKVAGGKNHAISELMDFEVE